MAIPATFLFEPNFDLGSIKELAQFMLIENQGANDENSCTSDDVIRISSGCAAILEKSIKEIAQFGLDKNQRVKDVIVLSDNDVMRIGKTSLLQVQHELILEELCSSSCEDQIKSTTMYDNVTSYMNATIENGDFTLILQANLEQCEDCCNEIQDATVEEWKFCAPDLAVVVESTSEPSQNPTPKPSKRAKSSKGKKSGKAKPTNLPTKEPTQKPTRRPKKRSKAKKMKKAKKRKRRKRTPKLAEASVHQHTKYYDPMRKRTPKLAENQPVAEEGQVKEVEETMSLLPVTHPNFSTDSLRDSTTFDSVFFPDRKRLREHTSDAKLVVSAKLLHASDQRHIEYQPLRKRVPKVEERLTDTHEVKPVEEVVSYMIPVVSANFHIGPTFYPTSDKESSSDRKRVRQHTSDAPPFSAKLPSMSNQKHTIPNTNP